MSDSEEVEVRRAWTDQELDLVPIRMTSRRVAHSISFDLYNALFDRHSRLDKKCGRCPARPMKCPWGDGLLHAQQIGLNEKPPYDRMFATRCDNAGCPSRRPKEA